MNTGKFRREIDARTSSGDAETQRLPGLINLPFPKNNWSLNCSIFGLQIGQARPKPDWGRANSARDVKTITSRTGNLVEWLRVTDNYWLISASTAGKIPVIKNMETFWNWSNWWNFQDRGEKKFKRQYKDHEK